MIDTQNITALRMDRQFLTRKANVTEYDALYSDMQPGQNVYWNGFGDPPSITFRADFDDIEYNRSRQKDRILLKGRFQGGNLGWIVRDDLELFAALAKKPLASKTPAQSAIISLLEREGPMNIALIKEMTGMLVKEITPILHRLQEAFIVYEDQYDGEWDRAWYCFEEMFPNTDLNRYTRHEALNIVMQRFMYRNILVNADMVKSFYKLTNKDIKASIDALHSSNIIIEYDNGLLLTSDYELLQSNNFETPKSVFVMHRNDFLVKSNEYWLKEKYKQSERDILQYILIDGMFAGVVAGKFKNGPYIIQDIVIDVPDDTKLNRKAEIIDAVYKVNSREHSPIQNYCGEQLL